MKIQLQVPPIVRSIAARAEQAGGKTLLVGGAVVDAIRGDEPKDWDIEVFGLGYERLCEIFSDLGPTKVGKAFGIVKLSRELCDGVDIDVNVPRRDNSIGTGHKDFVIQLDPSMTPTEAAKRRDFSINSMAVDLETMELVDPFGGHNDLVKGVLRATDLETFIEDPLRALRAMQLLARKAKTIEALTMHTIRGMTDKFPTIAKERVFEEFSKLLLKAERPSVGLEFLRESGWIIHFPELLNLIGCEQHPEWHPEGDVWVHTLEVTDASAYVRGRIDPDWVEPFVFGAMLHDVGKPEKTITPAMVAAGEFPEDRLFTAYGHDKAGVDPAEHFLRRMTNEKQFIERATVIVGEHMQPYSLHSGGARDSAWRRLHNKIRLDVIGWMSRCDCCGRPDRHIGDPDLEHDVSEHCFSRFGDLGTEPIKPMLLGRHLIGEGLKPGPHFGVALRAAYEAQIDNESLGVDELLPIALSQLEA